jgi:hypothetical protein
MLHCAKNRERRVGGNFIPAPLLPAQRMDAMRPRVAEHC